VVRLTDGFGDEIVLQSARVIPYGIGSPREGGVAESIMEWNIQSRAHACRACSRAFADQQVYHTLLFDEKQGYARLDVCQSCWEEQYTEGATSRKGFVSHWQGVFEVPSPKPEPIHKENAESLLRKLTERRDPRYEAAAFILAVMLERKRLLKVKDQFPQNDRRVFVYEQPGTGDVFTITDPALRLDQLETVQRDVAELLEHGLPEDDPPTPEAGGTAVPATGAATEARSEPDADDACRS